MWWMVAGAAVGAAMGGIGRSQQAKQEKKILQHQKEMAWQQYLYGKENSDKQYEIAKDEAYYQLNEQDRRLHEGIGLYNEQLNTNLMAQAYQQQDARIQTMSGIGSHIAQEAASGTRGNEANEMIRAYAKQGLEQQIDIQNQQTQQSIKGTVTGANDTLKNIFHEKDSWIAGGHRYESKAAQDEYNLNIANLGQFDYDWQKDWATPTTMDYLTAGFGGAQQGMSTAYSIRNYARDWGSKL